MSDPIDVLMEACARVEREDHAGATRLLEAEYPFQPVPKRTRKYTEYEKLRVFVRDGFVDRYTGKPLVYAPALRLLAQELPSALPYHPNWRLDETHIAIWRLGATLDHRIPMALGGSDEESNWVTTSMALNSAKSCFTIEELGLREHPPGDFEHWDGLLHWFVRHAETRLKRGSHRGLQTALIAARRVARG